MKLTRRELASAVTAAAAAAALAQTPQRAPATPEAELQAARDQVKALVTRLAGQSVPMATEPAFSFRA